MAWTDRAARKPAVRLHLPSHSPRNGRARDPPPPGMKAKLPPRALTPRHGKALVARTLQTTSPLSAPAHLPWHCLSKALIHAVPGVLKGI